MSMMCTPQRKKNGNLNYIGWFDSDCQCYIQWLYYLHINWYFFFFFFFHLWLKYNRKSIANFKIKFTMHQVILCNINWPKPVPKINVMQYINESNSLTTSSLARFRLHARCFNSFKFRFDRVSVLSYSPNAMLKELQGWHECNTSFGFYSLCYFFLAWTGKKSFTRFHGLFTCSTKFSQP